MAACSRLFGSGNRIPADEELEVIPETSYCAYCDNETIHGIEFERVPVLKDAEAVPLVADMTSNFLTRPVEVNKFGLFTLSTKEPWRRRARSYRAPARSSGTRRH